MINPSDIAVKIGTFILVLVVVFTTGLFTGIKYQKGSQAQAALDNYVELSKKIDNNEKVISDLSNLMQASTENLQSDITVILNNTKKQPVVVVKNGKCIPSDTFVDGINQAVDRANRK